MGHFKNFVICLIILSMLNFVEVTYIKLPTLHTKKQPTKMNLYESISSQTTFSLRLAHHVSSYATSKGSNLVFSPLSLHLVLSLIANCAKGPTLTQIVSVIGSSNSSASDLAKLSSQIVDLVLADGSGFGGPRLAFANGVWFDESVTLKDAFKEIVSRDYKAKTNSVDFVNKTHEAASQVNSWAEAITYGLIKNLLEPDSVDCDTRLVLTNALYFKGSWTEKFDPSKTKQSEFHLLDNTIIQVPFMSSSKEQYVSSYDNFSVLKLPYNQGTDQRQFSMYIFLPKSKNGISTLTEKIGNEPDFLNHHVPRNKVSLEQFKLPKFKISFGFESSEIFNGLGLGLMFKSKGDLTEMVDSSEVGKKLYVSGVFHKAFVEVNEEGTEASAATAAVITQQCLYMGPKEFVADHPFVFVIREDMTGVVLFVGHVLNPLLEE